MDNVNPLIREALEARVRLRRFQDQHEEVFSAYFNLVRAYNEAAEQAKRDLRQVNFPARRTDLGYGIIVQQKIDRSYDPRVLATEAPDLLTTPGVVAKIDKKEVERLSVTREDWMAACKKALYEIPATTAVSGLSTLEVDG